MDQMLWLRLLLRTLAIAALLWLHGLFLLLRYLGLVLRRAPIAERQTLLADTAVSLIEELGATFVKIGQFLSTRADVLPPHLLRALERLQDHVPPFPYEQVHRLLQEELGERAEELFVELDPYPVASASVAQVHRGRLRDGQVVAVKVLRPGIERTVRFDLLVLRALARVLSIFRPVRALQPVAIVDEFGHAVRQQLDFTIEAANNRRFRANFAGDDDVGLPRLVDELCTRRVLCMEYVNGGKLLGPERDPAEREHLARTGFRLLLKMIFVDGFVHADLHPGNLLVDGRRIVMLDVGLVAELMPRHRSALAQLFAAWAAGDAARLCDLMLTLAPADGPVDAARLRAGIEELMGSYRTIALGQVQLGQVLLEVTRLMRRQHVRLEPALTMILVAIGVLEGVGRQLAPHLDLVREALAFFATRAASQPIP
jgi:ubiquinone biosynthesis protein